MMRFFLRTTDILVTNPGNEVEEHNLIKAWTRDTGEEHEHLEEINLWYGYGRQISFRSSWRRLCRGGGEWYWNRVSYNQTEERSLDGFH